MSTFSFGEYIDEIKYKVIDERKMRASGGIMFLLGLIAFINAFLLQKYIVIPFISGFLMLNFIIGLLINPKFSPTMLIASLFVWKQKPLWVGAVQKRFAWSIGLILSMAIFSLSFFLLDDISFFEPVCMLCLICLIIIYFEVGFGICIGCKLYALFLKLHILPMPKERPNCTGDSCEPQEK